MHQEVVIRGFGGQGIMLAGQVLAYAGMEEGKNVLWLPFYTPEMRGGSAECTVIISDKEIGSPISTEPEAVIAMNSEALSKLEPMVKPGGWLLINSSLVSAEPHREDIKKIKIPATKIAEELGSSRMANMVIVGAYVALLKPITLESILKSLPKIFPGADASLISDNIKAIEKGIEFVKAWLRKER